MKKIFVLASIVMCCVCATQAHESGQWGASAQTKHIVQPMTNTSSSQLISMQGHERIVQAYTSRLVAKRFEIPIQDDAPDNTTGRNIRRVGPNKPNEPGVPIGNAMVLMLFAASYVLIKRHQQ